VAGGQAANALTSEKTANCCLEAARSRGTASRIQLSVEALGRNRDCCADFLREQGYLVFLDHPPIGVELTSPFNGPGRLGFELFERFHIGRDMPKSFLVFDWVQGRSLGADEQCLEITGQVGLAFIRGALQEARGNQIGQFLGQRISATSNWSNWGSELAER
jgi:hypothetical protein